jgi:DNA primase
MELPMTAHRVDFKHVRTHADFLKVLAHYKINSEKDGVKPDQFKALCPFHEDTKPSLKINTAKNIYHCFACGAKGNVLEFVLNIEDKPESELRSVALQVAEISGCTPTQNATAKPLRRDKKTSAPSPAPVSASPKTPQEQEGHSPTITENKVLSFSLQLTMPETLASWLTEHGISQETATVFGLGLVSEKSKTLAHRLGIPLHNKDGETVGYCGRYLGDDKKDDKPKYVLPSGFRKELEIFNVHRLPNPCSYVVLFESYLSVMRHHEHIPCASVLGRSISAEQIEILRGRGCSKIIVIFDGDEPGREGAIAVAGALSAHLWVRTVSLGDGVKPHHLSWDALRPKLEAVWPKKTA